jgi:hypothetical protein
MCSCVASEQTVIFLEVMAMLPTETHGKISVFLNLVSEGDKQASEILRMVCDDEIKPEDAFSLLDEYLEWRSAG